MSSKPNVGQLDKLPEKYRALFEELDPEDKAIVLKHLPHHNTTARQFANMVELGIDCDIRREALLEKGGKDYWNEVIGKMGLVLGVPESSVGHVSLSARIIGHDRMREIVKTAADTGLRITYSHLKELNRLSSQEHDAPRENIIDELLKGNVLSTRKITEMVDVILGKVRKVQYKDPVPTDEDAAFDAAEGRSEGDALGEISTATEIDGYCHKFVELLGKMDKHLADLEAKMSAWARDVPSETLFNMSMDALDIASAASTEYSARIRDIGIICENVMASADTSTSKVVV